MPSREASEVLKLNNQLRDAWLADATYNYGDFRRIFEAWLAQFEIPTGTEFENVDANEVPCIWAQAPDADPRRVLIHFHSGGYLLGSANGYRSFGGFLSAATGCRVLLVDYRLAPEHPYPAAVEDAMAVYRWTLQQGYAPANIAVCGDSAGGGLALVMLQIIRDERLVMPAAGISISPLADLAHTVASREECLHTDPLVNLDLLKAMGPAYFGDRDPREPGISPMYGNWSGLPPLLLFGGEVELLRDDGKVCAHNAVKAGVDATFIVGQGMAHIWPIYADRLPEARDALAQIGAFVRKHMAQR